MDSVASDLRLSLFDCYVEQDGHEPVRIYCSSLIATHEARKAVAAHPDEPIEVYAHTVAIRETKGPEDEMLRKVLEDPTIQRVMATMGASLVGVRKPKRKRSKPG